MMTLGSLFDGIGGWQLAAVNNGVKPLWSSEIDPFPASDCRDFRIIGQKAEVTQRDTKLLGTAWRSRVRIS